MFSFASAIYKTAFKISCHLFLKEEGKGNDLQVFKTWFYI
jgi:hypothetical protein